mmetsp:Transcript_8286/g.24891  ORF Transcript_8286/g.24891 Transcript_8286/m.24891 type:complete len:82 (-) Transcript_8286:1869-2114(-)|eukprot:scaffold33602_cov26-Tisochrysis_lutea.AAC.2
MSTAALLNRGSSLSDRRVSNIQFGVWKPRTLTEEGQERCACEKLGNAHKVLALLRPSPQTMGKGVAHVHAAYMWMACKFVG